eukprot:CAMPEP_0184743174 /NCGR_PEP_ID=MMETSP0315-20130426/6030_1 /TAXON_ID=101924 /ORGANISM="Rhodosorus marinus, Strain UTEX LB 2760" /LENGTH=65 /DNA_ID=CAMNT_0027214289 /DNA_START=206 /DNA_END=403 /DNA_ORIENTATION=-
MHAQRRKVASEKFDQNITKRGTNKASVDENKSPVGKAMIALFLFLIVGSSVFQLFRVYMAGGKGV